MFFFFSLMAIGASLVMASIKTESFVHPLVYILVTGVTAILTAYGIKEKKVLLESWVDIMFSFVANSLSRDDNRVHSLNGIPVTSSPASGPPGMLALAPGPSGMSAPTPGPPGTLAPAPGPSGTSAPTPCPPRTLALTQGPLGTSAPAPGPPGTLAPVPGPSGTSAPAPGTPRT